MKINEVESLVGITKKNIRFYEQKGLIHPSRSENGYREYNDSDVETLKIIKMLRLIDISIEEISEVLLHKKELQDVLSQQVHRIEEREKSYREIKLLCNNMIAEHVSVDSNRIQSYTSQANLMEKEGHSLVDVKKRDKRNKGLGSIVAALVVLLITGITLGVFVWLGLSDAEMPLFLWFIMVPPPLLVFVGVIIALILRMKEIKGGEEYEASNY